MKNLLTLISLIALSTLAAAEVNQSVFLPYSGGNLEIICRTLWTKYDQRFNTNSNVILKSGADGILATSELLSGTPESKFMCITNTTVMFNKLTYPEVNTRIQDIETIIQIARTPTVWYTPIQNPAKSFTELLNYFRSLNRPVNVGTFTGTGKIIAKYLASKYKIKINQINFKNGTQFYPSLADGSIDLAFDAGGGIQVAEIGKFRIVGYSSDNRDAYPLLNKYPNFSKEDSTLSHFHAWFGIAVPRKLSHTTKQEYIQKLSTIILQEEFSLLVIDLLGTTTGTKSAALDVELTDESILIHTYWK